MADEQNKWLDRDAAERLLRGEPLEAVDAATRARAARLAETLDALTVTRGDGAELQGEAAALAAFRAARGPAAERGAVPLRGAAPADGARRGDGAPRHAASRAATAPRTLASVSPLHAAAAREADANAHQGTGPDAGEADNAAIGDIAGVTRTGARAASDVGSVRLGRPAAPERSVRWGRPVRFGVAAALAGCMIGGVAVAAGTGVLPSPFGGRHEPAPAASVSAAASPEQPAASPSHDASQTDGGHSGGPMPGTGPSGSGTPSYDDSAGRPDPTATRPGTVPPGESAAADAEQWRQNLGETCRQYRDGTLGDAQTQRLRNTANSAAVQKKDRDLDRFCARVLDGSGDNAGGDSNGGKGDGNSNKDDGNGDGNGGGEGDAGFSAALPSASWVPASPGAPAKTLPTTQSSPSASASTSASPSPTVSASYSAGPTAP